MLCAAFSTSYGSKLKMFYVHLCTVLHLMTAFQLTVSSNHLQPEEHMVCILMHYYRQDIL